MRKVLSYIMVSAEALVRWIHPEWGFMSPGEFISLFEKPVERSLLQGIFDMTHALNLKLVADGVETVEQKERLKSMNCDIAQGYFYAKPTPAADYEKLLRK